LTLHRRLAEIYDVNAFYAFEQSVVRPAVSGYHYSHPSVMLLISAPLSLIPYVLALFVWLTTSWHTFYRVLKGTMPEGDALVFSLATPAVLVNAVGGQNDDWNRGFLSAAASLCSTCRWPARPDDLKAATRQPPGGRAAAGRK
jgi:hypothetical protein